MTNASVLFVVSAIAPSFIYRIRNSFGGNLLKQRFVGVLAELLHFFLGRL